METTEHYLPRSFADLLQVREHDHLKSISNICHYHKGDYVFRASQYDHYVYIMVSGRAKIARMSLVGNELIQWFCMPGDVFGISDENNLPNKVYAQTITACEILQVKKEDFDQLLLEKPRVSLLVIEQLSTRIHALGDMVLYMASDNANIRFVHLIKYLSDQYGQTDSKGIYIDIPTTHQDIADMIGTCRQTVSSIVSKFKRLEILCVSRQGIHIYQPEQLLLQLKHSF